MRLVVTDRAREDYRRLSQTVQKRVSKQFTMLFKDKRYPSLHAKKYEGASQVFQARIDRTYRFYFEIDGDAYVVLSIIKHP
jgi:mRNA-degrading endonuclease RelE of RelBE toxin-antitoxin system